MPALDAILLAGPTASGKSALAIELASRHDGVILNADSMQVYAPLNILSARPSQEDIDRVEHRLYGHVGGDTQYTTAAWIEDVSAAVLDVWGQGKLPFLDGGTGLYFTSLLKGLSDLPSIPIPMREKVRAELEEHGAADMYEVLQKEDEKEASMIKPNDQQRIARALEVMRSTGKSMFDFERPDETEQLFAGKILRKLILEPPRPLLHQRIERRFDNMVELGALDEVRELLSLNLPQDRTVLKAIGVPQFSAFLGGDIEMDEAIEKSKIATRQYAKRQSTWFRNQMDESWERFEALDQALA